MSMWFCRGVAKCPCLSTRGEGGVKNGPKSVYVVYGSPQIIFNETLAKYILILFILSGLSPHSFVLLICTWSHHLILWRNHFVWLPEVWIFLSASLGGWNRTEFFCILIVNLVGGENQLLWEKFQLPTKSSEKMTATFWSSSSSKGSWIVVKMGKKELDF